MQADDVSAGRPACGKDIACLCAGVLHAELREAIAADRAATVESLGAELGCGMQCGSCVPAIQEALGQRAWFAAVATARPMTRAPDEAGQQRLIYKVDLALAEDHPYPVVLPGQHIVVRARTEAGKVERTYTVVSQDVGRRRLAIAVRRKPDGAMTPWLLGTETPMRVVEISAPGGPGLSTRGTRSVVFFAAGVGVTPAVAMASALGTSGSMHLDYSVRDLDDAAFLPRFEARRGERPGFTYSVRQTAVDGHIAPGDIRQIAAAHPDARFYICGPRGYVDRVLAALRGARIAAGRIHVEQFALQPHQASATSPRGRAYTAGVLLSLLPALLLLPVFQDMRPHGHPNVGHEQLQCTSCHVASPASTRQALQAKAKHALGLRETGAVTGMQPVDNATCTHCHDNPGDRHAPHRFLEPRFEKARADTGAQACVSCHREHSQVRVTAPSAGYCASCHGELQVPDDRATPRHSELLAAGRWDTCLQCHDYHGNHKWTAPRRLQDAPGQDALQRYLKDGPSPYGPSTQKARKEQAS